MIIYQIFIKYKLMKISKINMYKLFLANNKFLFYLFEINKIIMEIYMFQTL